MIKRLWRWFKSFWQRLLGKKQVIPVPKPDDKVKPRELLTDAEYESLFLKLLDGVNDEGWSRGSVKAFLDLKNIVKDDFVGWLRRFGERLLAGDGENRELAQRMVRLSKVGLGELSQVAGEIGSKLLDKGGEGEEKGENVNHEGEEKNISEVDKLLAMLKQNDNSTQQHSPNLELENNKQQIFSINKFSSANQLTTDIASNWFKRGFEQLQAGDFEGSIASFDKAVEFKPDEHDAWYNRGVALRNLERFEEAIASYDKAVEIKPDYHDAWNNRGVVLCDYLGKFEEAIASFDKAVEFKPEEHDAWYNRGVALGKLERFEEAIASYDKAVEIKPDYHDAWLNRGVVLVKLERFEQAIASLDKAVEFKPDHYYAWYNRGVVLFQLERFEQAIASYNKAVEIKPDYHDAWYNRGVVLFQLERFEEAIASFDKAVEFKPDYHDAWYNRGNALRDLERFEEAIASYDQALRLQIDDIATLVGKGALLSNRLDRHEEAVACFDQAINFKPDEYIAWRNRGVAASKSISFNQFFALPNAFTIQNPKLNQRGYQGELASYQEGLKYCQKNTHPEGWGILHQAIGNAHYYQGVGERDFCQYWVEAETEYKKALITLTPENFPELHLKVLKDLIRVLFDLKKDNTAKQYRRQALEVFRNLLNSPDKSSSQKRKLQAEFYGFSQMRVDILIEDGDFIPALEAAERNKNFYLTWILDNQHEHILSPSYSEIKKLINPNTAIIYWHLSPFALTTFIIKPGADKPIVIPTQKSHKLETWIKNWDKQYENYRKGKKQQPSNPDWRDNLPELLEQLSEILNISHITETIQNTNSHIQNLVLIPHRDLHRFPLHGFFSDNFTIHYLPSAQIGLNLQQKQPISSSSSLLSIESPDSNDSDGKPFEELRHAEMESATICAMFPSSQRIAGSTAIQKNIKTALANSYRVFHFTGHATYNYQRPKLSCLALSGEDRLTLENISELSLDSYHLVSLSACETAITGNQTIDNEYVGLVSAFLCQGVTNVLSTLWTVESVSSALFMIEFYRQPDWNIAPAVALKRTQGWLRNVTYSELVNWYQQRAEEVTEKDNICAEDLLDEATIIEDDSAKINTQIPPYAHPYYWASFIITGKIYF